MMKVSVAMLGARMHYAVPRILHKNGMLGHLYTDICAVKGWPRLLRCVPGSVRPNVAQRLIDRIPHGIPLNKITHFPLFGINYAWKRASSKSDEALTRVFMQAGKEFGRHVTRGLDPGPVTTFTYNSAGLELIRYVKRQGGRAIMEQTIAPKSVEMSLLKEEKAKHPEWVTSSVENPRVSSFAEREKKEWEAANLILCGSQFVKDGIASCEGPADKCVVVPYGVELPNSTLRTEARGANRPIRVLTVGQVGIRKGSPYVVAAAKKLGNRATFRMVGSISVTDKLKRKIVDHVELTGPVPRSEVASHYAWADVFLLPSLCEGSATVTYEALHYGLPIICTPNTGSIIRNEREGFIVKLRDVEAIVDRIKRLTSDKSLYQRMSKAAYSRAEHGSLSTYSKRLVEAMRKV